MSQLRRQIFRAAAALGIGVLLASCTTPPQTPAITATPAQPWLAPRAYSSPGQISMADTALAYRHDAAAHLYGKNSDRIYKGILPPFLYAVAVIQVEVDSRGQLTAVNWLRAPLHAPEVIAEIERTVRQAAPFPAPVRLGHADYIETWLWDASGRFQLHTLTEGQSWVATNASPLPSTAQ
jgi:protein TonB